jgi:hypothetical protein
MAHFYGSVQGSRGKTSRVGGKNSGIKSHIRGWNIGVKTEMYTNEQGKDHFRVYKTGGSNNYSSLLIYDSGHEEQSNLLKEQAKAIKDLEKQIQQI